MKKAMILLLAIAWLMGCGAVAQAQEYVYNPSGILSEETVEALSRRADELSEAYDIDLLLAMLDESVGMNAEAYAPTLYAQLRGEAAREDYGVLVINLYDRTYGFDAEGRLGRAMNVYGARNVESMLAGYLSKENFSGAMAGWVELAADLAAQGFDGSVPPPSAFEIANGMVGWILALAALIAALAVLGMKSMLKTAKFQPRADSYIVENSLNVQTASEFYLYETVTRRKIERESSSPAGRGGSHSSSGSSSSCRGGGSF